MAIQPAPPGASAARTRRSYRNRCNAYPAVLLAGALLLAGRVAADTGPLVLLIQPLPLEERSATSYEPLAKYIEALTGRRCVIQTPPNFPAYWNVLRRNDYDIALDGPHFTDYRVHKFGFSALVKTPDSASYSLVARQTGRAHDPMQLVGRRIASLGLLSTGTARLTAMFPNPVRQPVLVEVPNADDALALLRDKRVEAAFLPTAAVNERMARGDFTVVLTTEPAPRLILSASPRLAAATTDKIRDGLLRADQADAGRAMLQSVGGARFEPVLPENYANQRNVLKSYWGY